MIFYIHTIQYMIYIVQYILSIIYITTYNQFANLYKMIMFYYWESIFKISNTSRRLITIL